MTPMNIESSHENHGDWHDYERDMIMKISISYARTSAVLFPCVGNKIQCHIKWNLFIAMAGLKIDEFSRGKMDATAKELMEEKALAYSCLNWICLNASKEKKIKKIKEEIQYKSINRNK